MAASGTDESHITWELDDLTLYISGTGEITASSISDVSGSYTRVVIEPGVTRIGNDAFRFTAMRTVSIPDSVTSIGDHAFYECTNLESVIIPDSVTSIGDFAFYQCTRLPHILIPKSVTRIGEKAFAKCEKLTTAVVANINSNINREEEHYAFDLDKDPYVSSFVLYSKGEAELVSDYISDYNKCDGLKWSLRLDNGCLTISPESNDDNSEKAINNYPDFHALLENYPVREVVIEEGVTSIGDEAFAGCRGLTSVTIPESVTSIGKSAFSGCWSLTSVNIPKSLPSIGDSAFRECWSLTSVTFPTLFHGYGMCDKTLRIENSVFYECVSLESLSYWDPDYGSWWYNLGISDLSIGDYAFFKCVHLKNDGFFSDVSSVGDSAFYGCSSLTSVKILENVTHIGKYAFGECTSMTSVDIPNSITSIGDGAYSGCTGLIVASLPRELTSIGKYAFSGCSHLTSVEIPESVTKIDEYAFKNCQNLESVTIKNPKCEIADNEETFSNNTGKDGKFSGTICGDANSTAYAYAQKYHYKFKDISNESSEPIVEQPATEPATEEPAITPQGNVNQYSFGTSVKTNSIAVERIVVTMDALKAANYQVPVLVKANMPNGVDSIEYGISADVECTNIRSLKSMRSYCTLPTADPNMSDYLNNMYPPQASSATSDSKSMWNCYSSVEPICGEFYLACLLASVPFNAKPGDCYEIQCMKEGMYGNPAYASNSSTCDDYSIDCLNGYIKIVDGDDTPYTMTTPAAATSTTKATTTTSTTRATTTTTRTTTYTTTAETTTYATTTYPTTTTYETTTAATTTTTTAATNGTCGKDLQWQYDTETKTLTISGTGEMEYNNCLWSAYKSDLKSVVIGDGVTSIGGTAFEWCINLSRITIPDSVAKIGDYAFSGCSGLTSVSIPDSVTSIGGYAFSECSSLTSITIPDSVTSIGKRVFVGCKDLTIYGSKGSYAKTYAEENAIPFKLLSERVETRAMLGDVNFDDSVDAGDASDVLIAAAILGAGGEPWLTDAQITAADVNGDGDINAADAAIILQYAAALGAGISDAKIEDYA